MDYNVLLGDLFGMAALLMAPATVSVWSLTENEWWRMGAVSGTAACCFLTLIFQGSLSLS